MDLDQELLPTDVPVRWVVEKLSGKHARFDRLHASKPIEKVRRVLEFQARL